MRWYSRFVALQRALAWCALLAVALGACAPLRINPQTAHVRGMAPERADRPDLTDTLRLGESGRVNLARIETQYRGEWRLRHARTGRWQPPQRCLALSGGGLRSAAFSIGVMMGLEEKEGLEQFDVISAVSGGSYALSWVYTQRLLGVK